MTGLDLRVRRVRKRLRQIDVARAAGLSRQRITAIESAWRPISPAVAARIVRAIELAASLDPLTLATWPDDALGAQAIETRATAPRNVLPFLPRRLSTAGRRAIARRMAATEAPR